MKVINIPLGTDIRKAICSVKAESYNCRERVVAEFNDYLIDSDKSEDENEKGFYKFLYRNKNEIDWEQRRYEIAKAALIGELASPVVEGIDPNPSMDDTVKWAVMFADALIKELKKEVLQDFVWLDGNLRKKYYFCN